MAERTSVKKSLEMRAALMARPMTYAQMREAFGLSDQRMAYWRKANAENIYVFDWAPDKNGRLFVPVFAWGDQPDKPRPGRAMSSADRMRAHRARAKQQATVQTDGGVGIDELI